MRTTATTMAAADDDNGDDDNDGADHEKGGCRRRLGLGFGFFLIWDVDFVGDSWFWFGIAIEWFCDFGQRGWEQSVDLLGDFFMVDLSSDFIWLD
jgi:hypothetical protein